MDQAEFQFRPITSADKARITEICSKIWEGSDYLPASFDSWLADTEGRFSACLAAGRVIGCGKLSFVAPGHAWLEGLRKDIEAPVKGVGRALCLHQLRLLTEPAMRTTLKSIRFATYIKDEASINLNEKIGFKRVATARVYSKVVDPLHKYFDADKAAPLSPDFGARLTVSPCADGSLFWERLRAAGWFERFVYASWKAWPADSPAALEKFLENGGGWICRDAAGELKGSMVFWLDHAKRLLTIVGLEAGDTVAAAALLYRAEQSCRAAGYPEIEAMLPAAPAVRHLFDTCAYQPWESEEDFLLYEFPLHKLADLG